MQRSACGTDNDLEIVLGLIVNTKAVNLDALSFLRAAVEEREHI